MQNDYNGNIAMGENQEFYKIDLYSSNPAPKDCNEPGVGWNTRNSDMLKWLNSEDDPQVSWLFFKVVRRNHDCGNIYRGKLLIIMSWLYSFRGLVHCHHGGRHGSMYTDMMLERSWEFYIQIHRQQEERDTGPGLSISNPKAHPYDTFLSARPHLLIVPLPGN